jgi:hypothetical protein
MKIAITVREAQVIQRSHVQTLATDSPNYMSTASKNMNVDFSLVKV